MWPLFYAASLNTINKFFFVTFCTTYWGKEIDLLLFFSLVNLHRCSVVVDDENITCIILYGNTKAAYWCISKPFFLSLSLLSEKNFLNSLSWESIRLHKHFICYRYVLIFTRGTCKRKERSMTLVKLIFFFLFFTLTILKLIKYYIKKIFIFKSSLTILNIKYYVILIIYLFP